MKKITLLLLVFAVSLAAFFFLENTNQKKEVLKIPEINNKTDKKNNLSVSPKILNKSIFIPYWSLNTASLELNDYQKLIYFGVSVNDNGIDERDAGYKRINDFLNKTDSKKDRYLTIRMLDSRLNSKTLDSKDLQKNIIDQSVQLSKDYGFKGIVLDFELSALSFESVIKEINSFYKDFYDKAKQNDLKFLITIYGDTFYRGRPYDISFLSKNSDGILIMTYDFHKSRGNPGPNFPLSGRDKYGYDLKEMIGNFKEKVPNNKITVIFGMFGYDWMVNEKAQPIKNGFSLSTNEIIQKFIQNCSFKDCKSERDESSSENKISYIDNDSNKHIIWYEDKESLNKKLEYIKNEGITSFGFWAYSYF